MEKKVRFAVLVRAPRERVYDAMTTAEGLDGWFTNGTTIDAKPGGRIEFRWKDWGLAKYTGENDGPVLEAKRPQRFVFQWKADSGLYRTTVEMDFETHEEGTVVRLFEQGYQESATGEQDFLNRVYGWAQALTLLKFYVENGVRY